MSKPKEEEQPKEPTPVVPEEQKDQPLTAGSAEDAKKLILDSYRDKKGVCPKCGSPLVLSNKAQSVMTDNKMSAVTTASLKCVNCDWHQEAINRENHVVPALTSEINMETRPMPRDPFEGTILDPNVVRRLRAEALARSVFGQSTLLGLPRLVPDPFGLDFSFPF